MAATPCIPICMVSPDPDTIDRFVAELAIRPAWGAAITYATCDGQSLIANLHLYQPACFLLDLSLGDEQVHSLVTSLQQAGYREFIFLGSGAGIAGLPGEVLPHGTPVNSLLYAISRLTPATQADTLGQQGREGMKRTRPLLLAVHSPKGGTGKTLIACSLAAQFAARGVRTLLVDLALYGSVDPYLSLPRRDKGLGQILTRVAESDTSNEAMRITECVRNNISHFLAGDFHLHLLLAAAPLKMASMTLEQTEALMHWLSQEPYEVIVVDTSSEISERTTVALKLAEHVLLPIVPELAAARSLLAMQDVLKNISTPGKLHVVVNRSIAVGPSSELEQAIGYPVVAWIPEAPNPWETAVSKDLSFNYSPFALALKHLAQRYRGVYEPAYVPALKVGGHK